MSTVDVLPCEDTLDSVVSPVRLAVLGNMVRTFIDNLPLMAMIELSIFFVVTALSGEDVAELEARGELICEDEIDLTIALVLEDFEAKIGDPRIGEIVSDEDATRIFEVDRPVVKVAPEVADANPIAVRAFKDEDFETLGAPSSL